MKPKRPSVLDALMAPSPTAPSASVQAEAPAPEAPKRRTPAPGVVHTSVYIPEAAYERLRELAFTQRRKINDVVLDGLSRILEEHGHAGIPSRPGKQRAAS